MIFVTVGTHEQQFNRLIHGVDELKKNGIINESVIVQIGFSTYKPEYCEWSELFRYNEMEEKIANARIVITHGAPASFIMALQIGKIPIVVPRQKQYDEHVNNHQVSFSKAIAERQGNIIVVEDIGELESKILNYHEIVESMTVRIKSNNALFSENLTKIADELLKARKEG